jgi:single-strand DNA-binding protein
MLKVFFDGRLGADAELRTAQNGDSQFYSMRVATDDFKNGESSTVWVNVRIGSERVGKMKFTKGSHVLVTGTLRTSTYQTKAGETAVSLDVMADSINYIKSGGNGTQPENTADTGKFTKKENEEAVAAASSSTDDLPF